MLKKLFPLLLLALSTSAFAAEDTRLDWQELDVGQNYEEPRVGSYSDTPDYFETQSKNPTVRRPQRLFRFELFRW